MANYLILNQPQVFNGLGTLTFTVPTTGNYYAQVQLTVPEAVGTGDGAGSGTGLGSGAGGGDAYGFATGGGSDPGGVGQGFGPVANDYPQPPSYGSNETSNANVTSGVTVLVKDNGSTIFTAPTLADFQSALQFKYPFAATAAHSITVVIGSSTTSDKQLSGVQAVVTIGQGS